MGLQQRRSGNGLHHDDGRAARARAGWWRVRGVEAGAAITLGTAWSTRKAGIARPPASDDQKATAAYASAAMRHHRLGPHPISGRALRLLAGAAALAFSAGCSSPNPAPPRGISGYVRIDQVGFRPGETKTAYLLSPREAAGERVTAVDAAGNPRWAGTVAASRGTWNSHYGFVEPIDLTTLRSPGTYRLHVDGAVTAWSPTFRIDTTLYAPLTANAVHYFHEHRDNAHPADQQATVYQVPHFGADDHATGPLEPVGGPVDVAGGWYDAGDYEKFTCTTAYALILMLIVQRDHPAVAGLADETRYGLGWLDKMWNGHTLLTQVGLGDGITDGGRYYLGDHDTWRLPQADATPVTPTDPSYYQRHRPGFPAATGGDPISPNLAGRTAAAFALAAELEAADAPSAARAHLDAAAALLARADTHPVGDLVTTEPRDYYPEDTWHDDLALATTELARAGFALHDSRSAGWEQQAAHWARAVVDDQYTDTLSVYDVSALTDAELGPLLTTTPIHGAEVDTPTVYRDLRARVAAAATAASHDPFGAAGGAGGSDYAALQFSYAAIADLYRTATGDQQYAAFATAQRAVALGANGWGTSLVIGAGTTYPQCPHDPAADLTPQRPEPIGGVVNGPNNATRVRQLIRQTRPSPCAHAGTFAQFDRPPTAYVDDAGVSATTEPAIDFTATSLLAFALADTPTTQPGQAGRND